MLRDLTTGNGPINREVTPSGASQVESVRIHLDAASATSETIVVKVLSASGSQYNVELDATDMNTKKDNVYQPTRPHQLWPGDTISVTWANSNSKIWGLEIIWNATA
jgi:hypothetical protein